MIPATVQTLALDASYVARVAFESGSLARGFVARVRELQAQFRPVVTVACWEGGGQPVRARWFPEYKAGRKAKHATWDRREEWARDLADLREHLPLLGVHQCWADGYEADDALATIARCWIGPTLIYSPDHDLLQLLGTPQVWIARPRKSLLGPTIELDDDLRDQPPRGAYALDLATLGGCSSDEVPGVSYATAAGNPAHMGPGLAAQVLEACPAAVASMLAMDSRPVLEAAERAEGRLKALLVGVANGIVEVARNRQLVSLHTVPLQFVGLRDDGPTLRAWARRHAMEFMLRNGSDSATEQTGAEALEEMPW